MYCCVFIFQRILQIKLWHLCANLMPRVYWLLWVNMANTMWTQAWSVPFKGKWMFWSILQTSAYYHALPLHPVRILKRVASLTWARLHWTGYVECCFGSAHFYMSESWLRTSLTSVTAPCRISYRSSNAFLIQTVRKWQPVTWHFPQWTKTEHIRQLLTRQPVLFETNSSFWHNFAFNGSNVKTR